MSMEYPSDIADGQWRILQGQQVVTRRDMASPRFFNDWKRMGLFVALGDGVLLAVNSSLQRGVPGDRIGISLAPACVLPRKGEFAAGPGGDDLGGVLEGARQRIVGLPNGAGEGG